ncbi:multivesicular body subunit 12A [Discoglossus pictus]
MEKENQTEVLNFILIGITDNSDLQTLIFLVILLIYLLTLGGNMTILLLVSQDPHLHTPMYFFLGNLSVIDMSSTTINLHKIFYSYISGDNTISFFACMTQSTSFSTILSSYQIVATTEGASANFVKGFNQKSAVYLCYSSTQEDPVEQVVTDIVILNEKTPLPMGCAYIAEYIDPKITVSKKKRLCVKLLPLNTADQAVCELKITMKKEQLGAPYQRIGEMNGLALWCKKIDASIFKPTPKPRNVVAGMNNLSLDGNRSSAQTTKDFTPKPALDKVPPKPAGRSTLTETAIYDSSNIYGISAIDGIPFTLHPMYENTISSSNAVSSDLNSFPIKTLSDIENEYNYGFVVERTAATRIPPEVY